MSQTQQKTQAQQHQSQSTSQAGVQTKTNILTASCQCGQVVVQVAGEPLSTANCYCDDCQAAARQIESRPGAYAVTEPDGGTGYSLYLKQRVRCVKGENKLEAFKLKPDSPTNRMIASCCNTPMLLQFDNNLPWVTMYRSRFGSEARPLEMRIFTKYKPAQTQLSDDLTNYTTFPFWLPVWMPAKIISAMLKDKLFGGPFP